MLSRIRFNSDHGCHYLSIRLAEAGIEPDDLTAALDSVPTARENWDAFPKSAKKLGLTSIATAKRVETRASRIAKIVADAAAGKRP